MCLFRRILAALRPKPAAPRLPVVHGHVIERNGQAITRCCYRPLHQLGPADLITGKLSRLPTTCRGRWRAHG